jgi:hypothetical protein
METNFKGVVSQDWGVQLKVWLDWSKVVKSSGSRVFVFEKRVRPIAL